MKSAVRLTAVCLVLACLASCGDDSKGGGTTPSGASLSGIVTDVVSNAPIRGVAVAVEDKTATTGSDGRYSLTGLTAGQATLTAKHQGHDNFSQNVTLAGAANVNIPMTPAMAVRVNGTWRATTPAATAFTLTNTVDTVAQTVQITLEVRGKRDTFTGPYALSASTATTHTRTSAAFGNISVTVPPNPDGPITGTVTNHPDPDILRIDFSATATATAIPVNLTVRWADGDVDSGTLTFTK